MEEVIGFPTQKIKDEWAKAPVALRLVVEALDQAHGGASFIIRLRAGTRFESGVHSTGLAADIELRGSLSQEILEFCNEVNARFVAPGVAKQVCTLMEDPVNLPSGKRIDTPHVHVQIPFDWLADPRAFLKQYGYT